VWVTPDGDGVMEWSGEGSDELLDCNYRCDTHSTDGPAAAPSSSSSLDFTPLVLFSCSPVRSENVHSAHHSWKYVQGAGDDEENWSAGLTSEMFWKNKDLILASDDPHEVL
jgi:Rit1 N-terminal domain